MSHPSALHVWSGTPRADDVIELQKYHQSERPGFLPKIEAFMAHRTLVEGRGVYLWQQELCSASADHGRLEVDGAPRPLLMMSSNNYLGLTTHPRVIAATIEAVERFGTGAGASPMLCGTLSPQRALERRLSAIKQVEDTCLFSSGYAANVGVLTALLRKGDTVFVDKSAHASLIDGARAGEADVRVFRHNDMGDLAKKLASTPGVKLIVVDAVYSMDGDTTPLPELVALADRHDAWILLDEAHSTGVMGRHGLGLCEHFGVHDDRILVVGTLSKALASGGGFFSGPHSVVEYVRHFGRSFMFSTAMPPSAPAAALAALEVMVDEPERVATLQTNARALRDGLRARGLTVGPTESPIVPVIVGDGPTLVHVSRALLDLGVHINPVFYPAVPRDQSRLRLSVMATHTPADIARTIDAVCDALGRYDLMPAARVAS